jgi:hypothetical protein
VVIVEGTQAFVFAAGGLEGNEAADNIDNVVGVFDLPGQGFPVGGQGAPLCRKKSLRSRAIHGKGGHCRAKQT